MESMHNRILPLLKLLWTLAIICFLSYFIYTNKSSIISTLSYISFIYIVLSVLLLFLGKIFLVFNMQKSLTRCGISARFLTCFRMYNLSQLAKYIPGSIWQFVGRSMMYKEAGIQSETIAQALLVEHIWIIGGSSVIGLLLVLTTNLQFLGDLINQITAVQILIGVVILLSIIAIIISRNKGFILRHISRQCLPDLRVVLIQVCIWLFLGASMWATLLPIIEDFSFFFILGIYAVAFVFGFITPFAPAGVGIRELILVIGLSYLVSPSMAVVVSMLNRILYLFVDIVLGGISLVINKTFR